MKLFRIIARYLRLQLLASFATNYFLTLLAVELFNPAAPVHVSILYASLLFACILCLGLMKNSIYFSSRHYQKLQSGDLFAIFTNVYEQAQANDPILPRHVTLYVNLKDNSINAMAMNGSHIVVTKGLADLVVQAKGTEVEDDTVLMTKGTLAHELGHLAHRDVYAAILTEASNVVIDLVLYGVYHVIRFFALLFFGWMPVIGKIANWMCNTLYKLVAFIISVLNHLFSLLTAKSEELKADAYSARLGLGEGIIILLDTFSEEQRGIRDWWYDPHPSNQKRTENIRSIEKTLQ